MVNKKQTNVGYKALLSTIICFKNIKYPMINLWRGQIIKIFKLFLKEHKYNLLTKLEIPDLKNKSLQQKDKY